MSFARFGLVIAGVLLLASGCVPRPEVGAARDLHAEMGAQGETHVPQLKPSPGALGPEAPYLPLVQPPKVQRVWITAHLNDAGDLIAGHWVYLMLEPSQWLLRDYQGPQTLKLKLPAPVAPEPKGK